MSSHSDHSQKTAKCSGTDRQKSSSTSNRKMASLWIYLAGLLLLLLHTSTPVSSEQILVWSQHSHKWTKLRGIYGPTTNWIQQPRKKFVTSESSRDKIYNSLGYDHKTRYLYWHDSTTRAIYRQHVNDSLVMRRDDNIELVFEGTSGSVGGLAVDWIGENVIWADNVQMAILMARKHPDSTDVSRIVINAVTEAVGVAVDPIAGRIYWGTKGAGPKIEVSTFQGEQRMTLAQAPQIGSIYCLTLDLSDNAIYFVDYYLSAANTINNRLRKLDLANQGITDISATLIGQYTAIASHGDYIYLLLSDNLELVVLNKNGQIVYSHVIDAIPHDIVVSGQLPPTYNPDDECGQLGCGDFCISLGASAGNTPRVKARCECRDKYYFELDGRTCTSSAPRYIYSVDGELWNAQSNIPSPYYSGDSTLTQIKTDYSQIEAIGFNFNKDLIYFSDTQKDNIYRGIVAKKDFIEHTVNEYNVQGISVNWLADTVYWADADLRHIMLSKLDGRYHKVLLENIGMPKGLAVDAINGFLYFVDFDQKSIVRTKTDGSDMKAIIFGLGNPHAIVSDPRGGKIYWSDGNSVKGADLDGVINFDVSLTQPAFGITLWQDILTWTESNMPPFFNWITYKQQISMSYQPSYGHGMKYKTYAIVSYNNYLQPPLLGPCLNNGGCQQLCYSLEKDHSCGCAIGYTLDKDGKSCNTEYDLNPGPSEVAENNFVLFMDPYHKALYQLDIGNSWKTNAIPIKTMDHPVAFDLDRNTGKIYWIDLEKKSIRSSFTNGYEEKTVWDFQQGHEPIKLAYDHITETVFFLDEGKQGLYAVQENGEEFRLLVGNIARPSGLALDIEKKLIYFTDLGLQTRESRVSVVSTDGSGERNLEKGNVNKPTGLTLHEKDKILYWCDGDYPMIYAYDIVSNGDIQALSISMNGQNMISLAVDDEFLYFSTRDKKSVFSVSRNTTGVVVPQPLDESIFARITDIRAYPGVTLIPPPLLPVVTTDVPVMWLAIGVAAAVLLALLFLLFACCVARRKKKPDPHAHPEAASGFDSNEEVEREFLGLSNPTVYDMKQNGHANGDASDIYMNVPNGQIADDSNGHGYPIVASAPELRNGHAPDDPNLEIAKAAQTIMSTGALKPAKYAKNSKRNSRNNPNQFEMGDGNKVATVIQRIATRLRTGLGSIRWNGDGDGRSSRGRNSQPPHDYSNDGEPNAEDSHGGKKYAKNRPPLGPIKPQLHRLPQGFAPASRVTPSNVRNTFGRSKQNLRPN